MPSFPVLPALCFKFREAQLLISAVKSATVPLESKSTII